MLWIGFVEPVTHAASNILDERLVARFGGSLFSLALYGNVLRVAFLPILWAAFGPPSLLSWEQAVFVAVSAACLLFSIFAYFRALASADTSVVAAYFDLGYVFAIAFAYVFLSQIPTPAQLAGAGLVTLGSLLVAGSPVTSSGALAWMAGGAVAGAIGVTATGASLASVDWVTFASWETFFVAVLTCCGLVSRAMRNEAVRDISAIRASFGSFALNESLWLAGQVGSVAALAVLPVALARGLSATQPLFVLFFGYVFSRAFAGIRGRESFDPAHLRRKIPSLLLVASGAVLLLSF